MKLLLELLEDSARISLTLNIVATTIPKRPDDMLDIEIPEMEGGSSSSSIELEDSEEYSLEEEDSEDEGAEGDSEGI